MIEIKDIQFYRRSRSLHNHIFLRFWTCIGKEKVLDHSQHDRALALLTHALAILPCITHEKLDIQSLAG